jgi:hypothetical protein
MHTSRIPGTRSRAQSSPRARRRIGDEAVKGGWVLSEATSERSPLPKY